MKTPRLLLFSLLLLGGVISKYTSAQVHVGPGQTYASIYAVCKARAAHPGDTIFMHAGTYTDRGQVFDSLIGTPSKWIYIKPWRNDSVSIHVTYTFQYAQYLNVSGLNFYGDDPAQKSYVYHLLFFDYNYDCFTGNHHIVIDHCNFYNLNNTGKANTGAMLKVDGTDNFQITNCIFKDGINITDGISLNANRNGLIKNCRFENMPGDGSHCKGGSKKIRYEQNTFINCDAAGLDIGGDTGPAYFCPLGATWEADSIAVFSNIFIGGKTGIKLSSCHNSKIFNNTCFKSTSFAFRLLNASSNAIYLANNLIYNNIFTTYSPNHIYLNASAGYNYNTTLFYNNLFHDYKFADPSAINWSEMPGVNVAGSIIGDPLFKDTLDRDFTLQKGSPAIGAGYNITDPVYDFYGRNFNANRAIGAIENAGNIGVMSQFKEASVCVFPNPVNATAIIEWPESFKETKIELYNLIGESVLSKTTNDHHIQIYFSDLEEGMYYLILQNEAFGVLNKSIFVCRIK